MPKKTKKIVSARRNRSDNDFFFFVVISVFAALTIFATSYVSSARQEAIRASQKPATADLAPLDIVPPTDLPLANPPKYQNPVQK
jgi:hypothetical protein